MTLSYARAKWACYAGNITQAITGNIPPLLFITFHKLYNISYSLLGLLVLVFFFSQLTIDLIFSFFSHKFNIRKTVCSMPLFAIVGLTLYALLPKFFPDSAFLWIATGTVICSVGSGLAEVLISPVIAAIPSENPDLPPAHTTGGAVDLTLIDEHRNELDMGTGFDDFSEKAETDYFEKSEFDGSIVQKNRRILKKAMESAGFTNLPSEWWHYDFGDRNWALYSKKEAIYKGVFNKEELNF